MLRRDLDSCLEEPSGDRKMSTLPLGSGILIHLSVSLSSYLVKILPRIINVSFRYFFTGESVLSKIVDSEMVALMTDNMYQVHELTVRMVHIFNLDLLIFGTADLRLEVAE